MSSELDFLKRANQLLPRNAWSVRHLEVLLALAEKNTPTDFGDLVRELDAFKPSVTRTSTALCSFGLVISRRNPKDGRKIFLTITDKGRDIVRKMRGEELQQERAA